MKLSLLSTAIILFTSSAFAQHKHQSNLPSETGQSQFAAIAEIVTLLRDTPETDWARVDIQALRDHLVDMDNVTIRASVTQERNGLSITFNVTGDVVVAMSIQRMVTAHSAMLQQSSNWRATALRKPNGASLKIQVNSPEELDQVKGLGFFGLMTIGAHHQQHHLMIASGLSPH